MKLIRTINKIINEEMAYIGQAALFKEQIMQMVQRALASHEASIGNQEDFNRVIDKEIDNIKAEMDITYDMIARALKAIPFHIFYQAINPKNKGAI